MFKEQQHEISVSNPTFDRYGFITKTTAVYLYSLRHKLRGIATVLR